MRSRTSARSTRMSGGAEMPIRTLLRSIAVTVTEIQPSMTMVSPALRESTSIGYPSLRSVAWLLGRCLRPLHFPCRNRMGGLLFQSGQVGSRRQTIAGMEGGVCGNFAAHGCATSVTNGKNNDRSETGSFTGNLLRGLRSLHPIYLVLWSAAARRRFFLSFFDFLTSSLNRREKKKRKKAASSRRTPKG
jgi:hypothetical protein